MFQLHLKTSFCPVYRVLNKNLIPYKMNSDYENIDSRCVDDDEGQEYMLISDSFEDDEEEYKMFDLTPQENCQRTQINQHSIGTLSSEQIHDEIWNTLKATRKCLTFVVMITVLLIISLTAVVLSIAAISYAVLESKKVRDT